VNYQISDAEDPRGGPDCLDTWNGVVLPFSLSLPKHVRGNLDLQETWTFTLGKRKVGGVMIE